MYDSPRPTGRAPGPHRASVGRTSADRPTGVASTPAHATHPGQEPPPVLDGRHRYDASAGLGYQSSVDPWWLREPVGDAEPVFRHPDTVVQRRSGRSGWYWLLLVPIVTSLLSPYYNRMDPALGGIPFFYWFPLSLNLVATACMLAVHLATKWGR